MEMNSAACMTHVITVLLCFACFMLVYLAVTDLVLLETLKMVQMKCAEQHDRLMNSSESPARPMMVKYFFKKTNDIQ